MKDSPIETANKAFAEYEARPYECLESKAVRLRESFVMGFLKGIEYQKEEQNADCDTKGSSSVREGQGLVG